MLYSLLSTSLFLYILLIISLHQPTEKKWKKNNCKIKSMIFFFLFLYLFKRNALFISSRLSGFQLVNYQDLLSFLPIKQLNGTFIKTLQTLQNASFSREFIKNMKGCFWCGTSLSCIVPRIVLREFPLFILLTCLDFKRIEEENRIFIFLSKFFGGKLLARKMIIFV